MDHQQLNGLEMTFKCRPRSKVMKSFESSCICSYMCSVLNICQTVTKPSFGPPNSDAKISIRPHVNVCFSNDHHYNDFVFSKKNQNSSQPVCRPGHIVSIEKKFQNNRSRNLGGDLVTHLLNMEIHVSPAAILVLVQKSKFHLTSLQPQVGSIYK